MNTAKEPSQTPSFEESLKDLEATVELLEAGELPLEESLKLFESGVGSLKRCHAILDQAEKRVRMLVKIAGGAPMLEDVGVASPNASAAQAPSAGTSPSATPVRKKSVKQSIDLEATSRQNTSSLNDLDKPLSADKEGPDELGPGGSLFAVSK